MSDKESPSLGNGLDEAQQEDQSSQAFSPSISSSLTSVRESSSKKRTRVFLPNTASTLNYLNPNVTPNGSAMRQPRFESHGTSSAAPANGQSEIEVRAKIATKLYSSKHVMECILTQYPHDNMVLARAVEIVGENEIVGLEKSKPDTHTELVKLALRINVTLSSNTAAVTSSAAQLRPSALVSTAHTPIKNPHLKSGSCVIHRTKSCNNSAKIQR